MKRPMGEDEDEMDMISRLEQKWDGYVSFFRRGKKAEAKAKAEREAKERAEREARVNAELEAMKRAEREAGVNAEREAKEMAEREARVSADLEAKEKTEREARVKTEREAKERAEQEARAKTEREAHERAELEARVKAELEAHERAEHEAMAKVEHEAKERTEQEARVKAELEAKERAEQEVRAKTELEAKKRAEQEARAKAEQEAKERAALEVRVKMELEAQERLEHEAMAKAALVAKEKVEQDVKAKQEAKKRAEQEAKANAKQANDVSQNEFMNHALWKRLSGTKTDEEFCHNWLYLQSNIIGGVNSSVVVLGPPEKGPFKSIAFFPSDQEKQNSFSSIINRALKEQREIVNRSKSGGNKSSLEKKFLQVALPIRIDGKLYGAVAMKITDRSQYHFQTGIHRLQNGIAWLEKLIINSESMKNREVNDRLACAVDLVAHTLQEDHFKAASTSFVTLLSTRLGCDRVSIGFMKGKHIKIQALSHSAQFKKQMNTVQSICSVMEESVDQQKVLVYPDTTKEGSNDILRAHDELAKQQKHIAICTLPFIDNQGDGYGALTLERSIDKPFDTSAVELCDSISALVAPVLEEKRKNDTPLTRKIWESSCLQAGKLAGKGHMAVKLSAVLSIIMVFFFIFAKGEYRITAKSTVEGKVQQAIVAPYDGYIFETYVKAGDLVKKEQLMCKLDDKDFRLEHSKLESQRAQYSKQHRKAMVVGKRADMKIFKEQMNQADTQLALLEEHLLRTKLQATFDGLVVSGDLSQLLGVPVERGQVLFEVSPLNDYRVRLEVDERGISRINVGQTGNLVLNALPKTQFPITIEKVTPVSTAEEGVNFFRVDAKVDEASAHLRPGMEGFGKIDVGKNSLIWIWTHSLTDWLRLWSWSWWP